MTRFLKKAEKDAKDRKDRKTAEKFSKSRIGDSSV
jgi:hypothetical protein